jgi:hypothetical protein
MAGQLEPEQELDAQEAVPSAGSKASPGAKQPKATPLSHTGMSSSLLPRTMARGLGGTLEV